MIMAGLEAEGISKGFSPTLVYGIGMHKDDLDAK